jgi:hypothetical protein
MLLSLQQRLGRVPYRRVGTGWLWMGLSAALMGLLAFFGGKATGLFAPHGRLGISVRLFPLIAVASGAYFGLLFLFQVDEARSLLALAKRKLARR